MAWGRFSKLVLAIGWASRLAWGAGAAGPFALLDGTPARLRAEDFGFVRETGVDPASHLRTLTLRDPQTGISLKSMFSEIGTLVSMEERTAGGALIERTEISGRRKVRDVFLPERHHEESQGEREQWQALTGGTLDGSCPRELTNAEIEEKIRGMGSISYQVRQGGDLTYIGRNFEVAGCDRYNDYALKDGTAAPGPKGVEGMAEDIADGMRNGMDCMVHQLGKSNPQMRRIAARMLAFMDSGFSRPIQIRCAPLCGEIETYGNRSRIPPASTATATLCPSSSFPSISINIDQVNEPGGRINSSFFHEMLHIAGVKHDEGVDIAYLATNCCSPYETQLKPQACAMLEKDLDWKGDDYQKRWSAYMSSRARYDLAMTSAWNAAFAGVTRPEDGHAEGAPIFAAAEGMAESAPGKTWEEKKSSGVPLYAIVMATAAKLDSSKLDPRRVSRFMEGVANRYYSQTLQQGVRKRELMVALANVVHQAMRYGNGERLSASLRLLHESSGACSSMSAGEKEMVRQLMLIPKGMIRITPNVKPPQGFDSDNPCHAPIERNSVGTDCPNQK